MLTVYVVTVTLLWPGNVDQVVAVLDDGFYSTMALCVNDNLSIIKNMKGPRPSYVKSFQCAERKIAFKVVKP